MTRAVLVRVCATVAAAFGVAATAGWFAARAIDNAVRQIARPN